MTMVMTVVVAINTRPPIRRRRLLRLWQDSWYSRKDLLFLPVSVNDGGGAHYKVRSCKVRRRTSALAPGEI